jgi:hypothetical protein
VSDAKRIYIAGPIGGTTDYHERFKQGCLEVAALGYVPVSPIEVVTAAGAKEGDWLPCMKADIRALLECDGVYCLRDWHQSRGARIEHFLADALGLIVLYQPEEGQ